jgi:hypothetical protein
MTVMSFMVTLMLLIIVGIYQANQWIASVNDGLATATGRYMMTVRGAVIDALSQYNDSLTLADTGSTAPAWAKFAGDTATISVKDLKTSALLKSDFPDAPPLGRSIVIKFFRTPGACPGASCSVEAYLYTCWPVGKPVTRASIDPATCPAASATYEFSQNLVGKAISVTEGYGGSNAIDPTRVNGTLFSKTASELGIPANSPGHVAVVASLNSTMFNQFVRQGDTRHIFLNNDLSVVGSVSTDTGLLIKTSVTPNQACTTEGLIATTARMSPAMCTGGRWFELANHVVTLVQSVADGATVTAPVCPSANMESFTYASIERLDVTMTGSDVQVRGNMNGTITGGGSVSQSGSVSVSGSYAGTVTSTSDSAVRVAQGVSIVSGKVVMSPANPAARAMIVQGCRYRG